MAAKKRAPRRKKTAALSKGWSAPETAEVSRMARALAKKSDGNESDLAFEFEKAPLLTLGVGHESRPRLSGGAYRSISRKTDDFLDDFDEAFDQLPARAEKFNVDRVKHEDMAKASGGPPDEEP